MYYHSINLNQIHEGYSPRLDYSRKGILKGSIKNEGLLEPIMVRQQGKNYTVIDGNERLRIVKELEWKEITCNILDVDEEESYYISYIKNTLRKNLNPIEDALHLQTVKEKFGYNHEDLVKLGYAPHRSTLDDKIGLLTLPETIKNYITEGSVIGPSIGYALSKLEDTDLQVKFADEIIECGGMSVSKVKDKVKSLNDSRKHRQKENQPPVVIPQREIPHVIFEDSRNMTGIHDESVALILTSPGYCVGLEYEKGVTLKDHLKNLKQHCSEWNRVLMPGGIIAVNFGDIHNFRTQNGGKVEIQLMGHYYQLFLKKYNIRLRETIIWRKGKTWINNPQVTYHHKTKHTSYRILNNWEHIYIFYKEGKREVPFDLEFESKIGKEEWKEWVDGVWEIPPVRRQEGHPAQFPDELVRRLVLMYSYKGDCVLDPFGGSMTTVKVVNELGRLGIGYELEEKKYKPIIMKKLDIKEEDLKKPDTNAVQREDKKNESNFVDRLGKSVTEILATENRSQEDIRSIQAPYKSDFSKDEILIDWAPDPEEPNPSGSPNLPAVVRADDYEGEKSYPLITLPQRKLDTAPYINTVILGDCLEKLKPIPDNTVDLLVTDPPYGIEFMGKDWDKAIPAVDIWKESLRVLKPGAFAFVMSAPRQDVLSRMIARLEDAGFITNFTPLYWTYATGFPKAYNIAKGIEGKLKLGSADWNEWKNLAGKKSVNTLGFSKLQHQQGFRDKNYQGQERNITVDFKTPEAKHFDGSYAGFQPKPAVEVIIVAMKPMDKNTYVDQALDNGKGISWLGDCRIPYGGEDDLTDYSFNMNGNQRTKKKQGEKLGLHNGGWKIDKRPKELPQGRFPANLLISDNVLDDGKEHPGGGIGGRSNHGRGAGYGFRPMGDCTYYSPRYRWLFPLLLSGCLGRKELAVSYSTKGK